MMTDESMTNAQMTKAIRPSVPPGFPVLPHSGFGRSFLILILSFVIAAFLLSPAWIQGQAPRFSSVENGAGDASEERILAADNRFPRQGEWPFFRGRRSLDGHAEGTGKIRRPHVKWRHDAGPTAAMLIVEPAEEDCRVTIPTSFQDARPHEEERPDRWFRPPPKGQIAGRLQPAVSTGTTAYADILPDVPGLERIHFACGFEAPTQDGRWQYGPGRLLAWRNDRWETIWETAKIDHTFRPRPFVGDFDDDGRLEVAALPWRSLLIYDAVSGEPEDRCEFTKGRSYGYFGVYDFDKDGKHEFLVLADFAKHVDVLGYRNGKLELLWQENIELDIADPQKIFRVIPEPVGDVDGDGTAEIVINLYNHKNDGTWHITVHDPFTGKVEAELTDEITQGLADVDGDGTDDLLTIVPYGAHVPELGTIRVRTLRDGQWQTRWEGHDMAWQQHQLPPQPHQQDGAHGGRVGILTRQTDHGTVAVVRRSVIDSPSDIELFPLSWSADGEPRFGPRVQGRDVQALSLDATGALLVRAIVPAGGQDKVRIRRGKSHTIQSVLVGPEIPAPPAVVAIPRKGRVVVAQGYQGQYVAFSPPGPDAGQPTSAQWGLAQGDVLRATGTDGSDGELKLGAMIETPYGPVIATLRGGDHREIVFATASPRGQARLMAVDMATRRVIWHTDFERFSGGLPAWNVGGVLLWQVGYFTDSQRQDVLVTLRRSRMHSEETFLLSGKDGTVLWHRPRQIVNRGCGGQPFAIADFDQNGLDDAASFYTHIQYILDGATGKDLIARENRWPSVPLKQVYWGQPVAGRFDQQSNDVSLLFTTTGRQMVGRIRADGSHVWSDAYDTAANGLPGVGDFDGDGEWEALFVGFADGIRCYDAATGKLEWTLDVGANRDVGSVVSGDVNADGRDEAVFVLDQTLYCVAARSDAESGHILWSLPLPTKSSTPVLADITGGDEQNAPRLSVLLVGTDGFVYCIDDAPD